MLFHKEYVGVVAPENTKRRGKIEGSDREKVQDKLHLAVNAARQRTLL